MTKINAQHSIAITYYDGDHWGVARSREVVMKTPLLTIIVVIALIIGGGLTIKKACKTGHYAWCVPTSTWHHAKATAPV